MDSTGKTLIRLLFNEDEHICVSDTHFACKSVSVKEVLNDEKLSLISNNPELPVKMVSTDDLILASINPMKPNSNRNDSSVSAFRTFLIEIDTGSLKEQINTIDHLKVPFSAQVFSGGKSIHTVITVDEDIPDEKRYRYIAKWLFNIVTLADPNCANPSRCVRIPGSYRDNGKKQRLRNIKGRITHKELMDWLNRYKNLEPVVKEKKVLTGATSADRLSTWVSIALKKGIDFRLGRNKTWFALAVDFAKAGYSEDQTVDILQGNFQEEHDFKEKEWLTCIKSGFKYVHEN